jgi:hypothetical protein
VGARPRQPASNRPGLNERHRHDRLLTRVLGRFARGGEADRPWRTDRLSRRRPPFPETSIEIVGAGDTLGAPGSITNAREAVLKIAARHSDPGPLNILSSEIGPMALVAQGMTGYAAGRPKPAPRIALTHLLMDEADV